MIVVAISDRFAMYAVANSLNRVSDTSPETVRADILCQFCTIHVILFASPRIDADQILGAVILTEDYTVRTFARTENDGARIKEQEKSASSNLCENPKLTIRQRQIMSLLIAGETNKSIALILSISQRTVENHRAAIMKKTGSKSFPALVGIAFAAEETFAWQDAAKRNISCLTPRQRHIMKLVLSGQLSKNIAADLNISQRTVVNHRASIMKKTGAKSLSALACLALAAA